MCKTIKKKKIFIKYVKKSLLIEMLKKNAVQWKKKLLNTEKKLIISTFQMQGKILKIVFIIT